MVGCQFTVDNTWIVLCNWHTLRFWHLNLILSLIKHISQKLLTNPIFVDVQSKKDYHNIHKSETRWYQSGRTVTQYGICKQLGYNRPCKTKRKKE